MPDLKNSQRISYKATYNQMSPGMPQPTQPANQPRNKPTPLKKALEKTAFLQSLKILPKELAAVRSHFVEAERTEADKTTNSGMFAAIEKLVNDKSLTSTINNASDFADIDYKKLAAVASALNTYRKDEWTKIQRLFTEVQSVYKEALQPAANNIKNPETTDRNTSEQDAKTDHATNSEGIAVSIKRFSSATKPVSGNRSNEKRAATSEKMSVSMDASKSPFVPVLSEFNKPVVKVPEGTTNDAIIWAERHKPVLFDQVYSLVEPYLEESEKLNVIKSKALIHFIAENYSSRFNPDKTQGNIAGFETRMNVEPVGNLHLERIEMYPVGVERGELVHSVPLAPGETVNISHKEWSVRQQEFEDIVQDYFEGYSEEGVSEKNDLSMSNESQSKHATALNIGASLSASYSSVTLSTSFGYNATSDDQQSKKDSRNHSMQITKKASARTKKDHKVTFKVTSVVGSEDQSVRVINNPSDTDAMRIDYFQLARKWKADLLRYGLRMTYDIVIPDPGSALITKVRQVKDLDALINVPFAFNLPLSAITYNSLATDPHYISNYDVLAAQYDASVAAPPEAIKYVNAHKETTEVQHYDYVNFDSLEFDIDDQYYIHAIKWDWTYQHDQNDNRSYLNLLNLQIADLINKSGHIALDFVFQYIYDFAINLEFTLRPKVQILLDWRLQVWNQIRQAAEEHYYKNIENNKDQRAMLLAEINNYDALTLRRMEQEEIMKGVLRWIFGPAFYLVPPNISALFGFDTNDPEVKDVLDPNRLTNAQWQQVLEHGEFIKYIHNAIEWENVLYFTYPYFWDDNQLWDFKKFLFHPDQTHKVFLRAGAARVVLTIRPGFESSFTQLVENGAFNTLPGPHPYVTIAQEIQNFAKTNYPGFPPANPEQNARPLLYLEQRRVWKEMQFIIQLLDAFKSDPVNNGHFPAHGNNNSVPTALLNNYLNGNIIIDGLNYAGVNDYNTQANAKQLALDPNTPLEALLPTYANVPVNDYWGNPYFYKFPGDTGDYDLISLGADGQPGGTDKDADISANAEASLIATWYEYTPISALDIGITMNQPNVTPAAIKNDIA